MLVTTADGVMASAVAVALESGSMDEGNNACMVAAADVLLVDGRYYGFSGCHRYEVGDQHECGEEFGEGGGEIARREAGEDEATYRGGEVSERGETCEGWDGWRGAGDLSCSSTHHLHSALPLLYTPSPLTQAHVRLGLATIRCRVRRANQAVLKMHMM